MSFVYLDFGGERADVATKTRVTDSMAARLRALMFYRLRLDGQTDGEIARCLRFTREYVNRQINGLPIEAKSEVRRQRLRAIRADRLLIEAEMAGEV